ncbi:unnamed protein product [Agarophyton chilense]
MSVNVSKKHKKKMGARLQKETHLGHIGGGVYKVLTFSGTVNTKHVRFHETHIPGAKWINEDIDSDPNVQDVAQNFIIVDSSDDEGSIATIEKRNTEATVNNIPADQTESGSAETDNHISLTHYPEKPSTFDGNRYESNEEDIEGRTPVSSQTTPGHRYNLKSIAKASIAVPDVTSTSDEPPVSHSIPSKE